MLSNVMYHLLGEDAGDKTHLELSATFFLGFVCGQWVDELFGSIDVPSVSQG